MPAALTPGGQPITCDGCGALVEAVTAAMRHPVPVETARSVYGKDNSGGDLIYIVCAPLPDGTQRCRLPGCDGTRCRGGGCPR
jgi:hypothetical protein